MRPSLHLRLEQEHHNKIDVSPLLDVVFILLIFFIVTTVFVKETGVDIDKPQALSTNQLPQSIILIAITDSGQVVYGGSPIGISGVRSTVVQLIRKKQRPVVIQADKQVPTELLVKVLDESKLAGATDVSLATEY